MLKKTRIAVLVSGGGTNLQALIDAQNEGIFPFGPIVYIPLICFLDVNDTCR